MSVAGTRSSGRLWPVSVSDLPGQREAFDLAPTSLSVTDPHGRIVTANQAFWKLFRYDPETPLNVGMWSRDEDQAWTSSYLTRLMTGESDEFQSVKRFVRGDGTEFDGHVTIRALRRNGRCIGMVANVEPTDVRPALDDNRVRKLIQHSAGTLTLVDVDGRVIETSGRYTTTLGYPPEFWEERTILDLLSPEDIPRVVALRDEILAEPGGVISGDFHVHRADRAVECLEVTAVNMLHDPDLNGIVLSTRNVTSERQNTMAIGKLRDDAVAEAERRSHLLATVSHELRNPLHAITGLAELLSSDPSLPSAQQTIAASLHRQLIHLSAVTDDLLDTARLEVGHFELRPGPVAVRDVVDDLVRVARATASDRIEIAASVVADVPRLITTDPARLQQLLGNIVGNAVKFTDEGTVEITVRLAGDGTVVFAVADSGPGIPASEVEHVFQPFTTATTSGDRRGAGLGLAIVRRLVDALGGTIEVTSRVGVGSVFTVSLPYEVAHDAPDGDREDALTPTYDDRPRVLVIEDTLVNQELARHQLGRLHMDAVVAESAERGLELLGTTTFDAILMDHQLPGMNGRDATREIRRRGISTPVIGLTASSTAADERACLDAGMNVFIPKPAGLQQLRSALETVLPAVAEHPTRSEPATVGTSGSAVDVRALEVLVGELGDRGVVENLVRTFLDELDARGADIVGSDEELAARQAHTLKSSAQLLGAHGLSGACARAGSDEGARRAIGALVPVVRDELTVWLETEQEER